MTLTDIGISLSGVWPAVAVVTTGSSLAGASSGSAIKVDAARNKIWTRRRRPTPWLRERFRLLRERLLSWKMNWKGKT